VVELVCRRARKSPLVLAVEDAHWADKSSLAVLARLAEKAAGLPLLLVCTGRPHPHRDWQAGLADAQPLQLAALDRAETAALVRAIRPDINDAHLAHVVERANGVAVFARELAVAAEEGGRLPMSLEAGLQARLDALPEAKAAARLAASIGIEFPLNLFRMVAGRHPREARADLIHGLRALVDNGMLDIRRRGGQILYRFRHALVRDAIYATQIRRERHLNHLVVAQALEAQGGAPPALLAGHFQEAGRVIEAVTHWCAAAEQALATGEAEQAIVNGENGLEALRESGEAPLHPEVEIRLQLALGSAHAMLKGYSTRAAEEHFSRAMAVSGAVAATPVGIAALFGFYSVLSFRWRWAEARTISDRLGALARTHDNTATTAAACYAAGHSAYYGGRISEALEVFARMPLPDKAGGGLNAGHAIDLRSYARSMHAMALWLVGRRAEGLAMMDEVVARCQGRPVEQAPVVTMCAYLCVFRRDFAALAQPTERLRQLCDRGGLMQWKSLVLIAAGLAAGSCPETETVDAALDLWTAAELGPPTPTLLYLVIAAHHQSGRWEATVRSADELLATTRRVGAHFYDVESLWMRGQALAALGRWAEAEETLDLAFSTAGRLGMAALELRILTARARLHQAQGDTDVATALLPAISRRLDGAENWERAQALDLLGACGWKADS
jgi:tetratricopeptide (TPR) repeat protein